MFSLHVTCRPNDVESLSFELWELGTVGIREEDRNEVVELIAGFADQFDAAAFEPHHPHWEREDDTDWVAATEQAWPGREVGDRIFLVPVWNHDATPVERVRIIHNPGLASGTGEHPCTQLALQSLEVSIAADAVVADIGTGSGILALAAIKLGAKAVIAVDVNFPSLLAAHENFALNDCTPAVAQGSADCIANEAADVVVANISGTVMLSLADELLRILRPNGLLILTGFPESELSVLVQTFGDGAITQMHEWRCLTLRCP